MSISSEIKKQLSFLKSRLASESGEDAKETEKEINYYENELKRIVK